MARPIDYKNKVEVQEHILKTARNVFCKKGFIKVTMSDLIKEAGMSRGGFYYYYDSVAKVFKATVDYRKKIVSQETKKLIQEKKDFNIIFNHYLDLQKHRLLNIDTTLLRALYEYLFTNQQPNNIDFSKDQQDNIQHVLNLIFDVGIQQEYLKEGRIKQISEHIMFTIEGLNATALCNGLDEETIDRQFIIFKQMISEEYKDGKEKF